MKKRSHPPPEPAEETQAQHICQGGWVLALLGHQAGHLATSVHLFEFPCFEPLEVAASESLWGRMSIGPRAQVQSLQIRPLTWAQGRGITGSSALPHSQGVAGWAHYVLGRIFAHLVSLSGPQFLKTPELPRRVSLSDLWKSRSEVWEHAVLSHSAVASWPVGSLHGP